MAVATVISGGKRIWLQKSVPQHGGISRRRNIPFTKCKVVRFTNLIRILFANCSFVGDLLLRLALIRVRLNPRKKGKHACCQEHANQSDVRHPYDSESP